MLQSFFETFLREFESLQVFALCKDFDDLSLEDRPSTSTSTLPSSPSSSTLASSLREEESSSNFGSSISRPLWSRPLIESLGAPFVDVPQEYIDTSFLTRGLSSAGWVGFPP